MHKVIDHLAGIYPFVDAHRESFSLIFISLLEQTKLRKFLFLYNKIRVFRENSDDHDFHCMDLCYDEHLLLDIDPTNFLTHKMVSYFYQKPLAGLLADFKFVRETIPNPPSFGEPIDSQLKVLFDKIIAVEICDIIYNILLRVRYQNADVNSQIHCTIKNYLCKKVVSGDETPIDYQNEFVCGFLSHKNSCTEDLTKIIDEDLANIRVLVKKINQMTYSEFQSYIDRIPDIKYCYYQSEMISELGENITRDRLESFMCAGNGLCLSLNWESVPDFKSKCEPLRLNLDHFEADQLIVEI